MFCERSGHDLSLQEHWLFLTRIARVALEEARIIACFVTCQTTVTERPEGCAYRRFQVLAIV